MSDNDARVLAVMVIRTLDAQQQYFRHRTSTNLKQSIEYERVLRELAVSVLAGLEQQAFPLVEEDEDAGQQST